jgi:hypothetical protein
MVSLSKVQLASMKANEVLVEDLGELVPSRWDSVDGTFFVESNTSTTFRFVDTTDANEGREIIVAADALRATAEAWLEGRRHYFAADKKRRKEVR